MLDCRGVDGSGGGRIRFSAVAVFRVPLLRTLTFFISWLALVVLVAAILGAAKYPLAPIRTHSAGSEKRIAQAREPRTGRANSSEREAIISMLDDMPVIADKLGAGTVEANHPFVDRNIDSFKQDVNLALADVKADPPSYYRAGRLSGRCLACHRMRP